MILVHGRIAEGTHTVRGRESGEAACKCESLAVNSQVNEYKYNEFGLYF